MQRPRPPGKREDQEATPQRTASGFVRDTSSIIYGHSIDFLFLPHDYVCVWGVGQVTGDGHFLWCLNAQESPSSWVSFAKAADAAKKSRGHRQEADTAGQHLQHIKEVLQVFGFFFCLTASRSHTIKHS